MDLIDEIEKLKTMNTIPKMKKNRLFVLMVISLGILISCGKPKTPESIEPEPEPDLTGGYKVVARFHTPGYAQDVKKQDTLAYMAQGEGGLLIVDVRDAANPQILSQTTENVRGYSTKLAIKDSVVYVAAGTFGLTVLYIPNPYEPFVTVSNLNMKPARAMHIMGDYLFTAISEQGVRIADISFPVQPDVRGGVGTAGYAYDISTSADSTLMFVACGELGLSIFDISNFEEGFGDYEQTGWCDTPGYAEAVAIDDEHSVAFLACGTSGLQIIDYADSANIHIVAFLDAGGYAKDLVYKDHKVFMTAELSGLQVIDVADPTKPKLLGEVDTEYAVGIDVDNNYVYIADEDEGLIIISRPN